MSRIAHKPLNMSDLLLTVSGEILDEWTGLPQSKKLYPTLGQVSKAWNYFLLIDKRLLTVLKLWDSSISFYSFFQMEKISSLMKVENIIGGKSWRKLTVWIIWTLRISGLVGMLVMMVRGGVENVRNRRKGSRLLKLHNLIDCLE